MRVNVYSEEMTDRIEIIAKEIEGQTFTGLRFYLELPCTIPSKDGGDENVRGPFIHQFGDDDSAAVTFWGKQALQPVLAQAIDKLNRDFIARGHPVEILAISRDELLAALTQWEKDARDGKTRSHEEADALPVEQASQERCEDLWSRLTFNQVV